MYSLMEMVLRAPIVSQSLQRTSSSTKRHTRNACFAAQPALFGYKALARETTKVYVARLRNSTYHWGGQPAQTFSAHRALSSQLYYVYFA